jgi:rare lipoprotein A
VTVLKPAFFALAGILLASAPAAAQRHPCRDGIDDRQVRPCRFEAEPVFDAIDHALGEDPAAPALEHRLSGTACYYSAFFDGRKTASGEIYRSSRLSAAHQTLPFGSWVEIRARATGKTVRLKVNDRGPFAGGFVLDLSRAAARALGVDRAEDRWVEARVIAFPGEEPPAPEPEDPAAPALSSDLPNGAK